MTIERISLLGWIATCDDCGERSYLGIDEDATLEEAIEFIEQVQWTHHAPDKVTFKYGIEKYAETYQRDTCADCSNDEPRPKPVMRKVPITPRPSVGIVNDPCDEWNKHHIFRSLGLMTCGHPRSTEVPCPACVREAETGRPYRSTLVR